MSKWSGWKNCVVRGDFVLGAFLLPTGLIYQVPMRYQKKKKTRRAIKSIKGAKCVVLVEVKCLAVHFYTWHKAAIFRAKRTRALLYFQNTVHDSLQLYHYLIENSFKKILMILHQKYSIILRDM